MSKWRGVNDTVDLSKVHYLMTATKATQGLCTSLAAALVHDAKPVLLQWGLSKEVRAPSYWIARLGAVQDYINFQTEKDEIIVMTDGYDAWLQKPLDEVIRDFKQSGKRILFPAEKFCWVGRTGKVFEQKEGFRFCDDAPHSPLPEDLYGTRTDKEWKTTRPRWLNAGVLIGYSQDLKKMYKSVMELQQESGTTDDQGLLMITYFLNKNSVSLDFYGGVVKSLASAEDDVVFAPQLQSFSDHTATRTNQISSQLLAGSTPRRIYDINSKSFPGIVHFNGPGKTLLKPYFEKSWWTPHEGSAVTNRVLNFLHQQEVHLDSKTSGSVIRWSDICKDNYGAQDVST